MSLDLATFRQSLHLEPELSNHEEKTASRITQTLRDFSPHQLINNLGGFGVAAVFRGKQSGPNILVRCELDALPIAESIGLPHCSNVPGTAHKCGHDGHMTIMIGLAEKISKQPLTQGSVILLFQPAEETGEGAARVIADEKFKKIEPNLVLALHNLPGFPLGQVILRPGPFASASIGVKIYLNGKTAHAAEPEAGRSPALAVAQLIQHLSAIPQFHTSLHEAAQATVIHTRVGNIAFGTSPGEGEVMATLRAHYESTMLVLKQKVIEIAEKTGQLFCLDVTVEETEPFPSTHNDPHIVNVVEDAARDLEMDINYREVPFAWSEDFGHFTAAYQGALFGLGAGEKQPALHHPEYDFPDELIPSGVNLLYRTIQKLQEI